MADNQGNNRDVGYGKPPVKTQFKPGKSGNPKGRPKSITLSESYRRMLSEVDETDPERRTRAEVLAEQMYAKAKAGDVAALREIADRVEGRARQTVAVSDERSPEPEDVIREQLESIKRDYNVRSLPLWREAIEKWYPQTKQVSDGKWQTIWDEVFADELASEADN